MICLDNTDVIEGGASVDAVIDYQMHGLVGSTFTQLAAGVMNTTLTTVLYTAGAAVSVVSIILVNKHTSAVNVTLCLDPANGGNPRYIIPKTVLLGAGYLLVTDGVKFNTYNEEGALITGSAVDDTAYAAGWNGEKKVAPSKNALYDKIQTILGDVTAAANITDNRIVRGNGGAKGVQETSIIVSDNGEMTNPSQPAFSAHITTTETNVTGDGTVWNSYDGASNWTEFFDQNADFDGDGTFTAPVSGVYQFNLEIYLSQVAATHTRGQVRLVTSNRIVYLYDLSMANLQNGTLVIPCSCQAWMDANDTAYIAMTISNGAKEIDISTSLTFTGRLCC